MEFISLVLGFIDSGDIIIEFTYTDEDIQWTARPVTISDRQLQIDGRIPLDSLPDSLQEVINEVEEAREQGTL